MSEPRIIELRGVTIECRVDETLAPTVLRPFAGTTPLDSEVDALPLPERPRWLRIAIRLLRGYRSHIGHRLGHRCVFEPSCSRFAELALRRKGAMRGLWFALRRLSRRRPGAGGIDLP
ncbi:MAG: membrane protein insertion efficiency factor YidD [Candidatus Schekmanbacteria bacterium]|nr:membrane protein insertion efficiency factor YidD [Candidatus Schekmanbacteria bacterium]